MVLFKLPMNSDAPMFRLEVRDALLEMPTNCDLLARGDWLRRRLPSELARAASELASLRERAAGRYFCSDEPYLTRRGLEQSTHPLVARKRASWVLESMPGASIHDATAGLGSDTAELSRLGMRVVSGDLDPVVSRCAMLNLERSKLRQCVILGDALATTVRADVWLCDPDRRVGGKRSLDPESWSPSFSDCLRRASQFSAACLKLAPAMGVPPSQPLPSGLSHSWEWTSLNGELLEVALWTGELTRDRRRRAVALDADGGSQRFEGEPEPWPLFEASKLSDPTALEEGTWLIEPDPALLQADLVGPYARGRGFQALHPGIGFLLSGAPPKKGHSDEGHPEKGPHRSYRILGACTADRKAVRRMLGRHDIGPIDLKRRGVPGDPSALARRFRGPGARRGLLALSKVGSAHWAFLLERP